MAQWGRYDKGYTNFLTKLAKQESGNNPTIVNKYGYVGLYQMGEAAMYDAGIYKGDSNNFDNVYNGGFTGKHGIDSLWEFRYSSQNRQMQTDAVYDYHLRMYDYLKSALDHSIQSYIGKDLGGGVKLTLSGLIGGAHLKGAGGVHQYLDNGKDNSDANGTKVSYYLKKFSGDTINWSGGTDLGEGPTPPSKDDVKYGTNGNDTLHGYDGNDKLYGKYGNDKIYGDSGNDLVSGQEGNDYVYGGDGNDQVFGGSGWDYLDGGTGNDKLYGWTGNDTLVGGSGNDYLDGGDGNDKLWGGSGFDIFRFAPGSDRDVIYDFDPTSTGDVIDIKGHRSITSKADLFANHVWTVGNNTIIDLAGGDVLTLVGVKESQLGYEDFWI